MVTMNAAASTEFQPSRADDLAASRTRLRPHTRWLAAAATAQRCAALLLADETSEPRASVAPILDAWTSLVLATWPEEHVSSDMRLVERAEALLRRHGETEGERARTWVELSTLLRTRRGGEASPVPLGRDALAAHVERLGRLIAAPRRPVAAPMSRPARSLGLVLLGLVALALWLGAKPGATPGPAPTAQPRVMR